MTKTRISGTALMILLLVVGLLGCGSGVVGPTVLLSDLTLMPGETGTLELKAYYLTGLQVLQVGPEGRLIFDPEVIRIEELKAANGFELFAHSVDNAEGEAVFLLAYPGGSLPTGTLLEITVRAVGPVGSRSFVELTQIDLLADTAGAPIGSYDLRPGRVTIGKDVEFEIEF